jgi:hypothetical protein
MLWIASDLTLKRIFLTRQSPTFLPQVLSTTLASFLSFKATHAGDIFGLAFPLKIFTVPHLLDSMLPDLSHVFPRGVDGSIGYNSSHPRPGLLFAWWSIASECDCCTVSLLLLIAHLMFRFSP